MRVTVKLLGVLAPADRRRLESLDFELRDGVTAGELLRALSKRCGAPFRQALESSDPRLPRHIRMFADGEMLTSREQALAPADRLADGVTVVLLTPMMGG
jgi:molybdopterin converting factor small subunit